METRLLSRIKLRQLQCALAVAESGRLAEAAERLAISQPAVSKTLRELEEILGVRLFDRGRRGAVPTADGERFLRYAGMTVSALRAGVEGIEAKARGAEALAIGALPTVAPALLPQVALEMRRTAPAALLRVVTAANLELLAGLKSRELALVVGRMSDPGQMAGVTFEHLYSDPLALVVHAGHPLLAAGDRMPFAALARYPAILPTPGTIIRHSAESLLRKHGLVPPADCVETLSLSFARNLALASEAVWYVPLSAVEGDLASGALARLPISTAGTEEPIGLMLRADSEPGGALRALMGCVRNAARARAAGAPTARDTAPAAPAARRRAPRRG